MARVSRWFGQLAAGALAGGVLVLAAACGAPGSAGPTVISGHLAFPKGTSAIPCASVLPTSTVTPPTTGHLIYNRTPLGPLPVRKTISAGMTISYEWCAYPENPQPSATDGESDARVTETLKTIVYGPYPTRAAAMAEEMSLIQPPHGVASTPLPIWATPPSPPTPLPPVPAPAPALMGPPVQTDTWSDQTLVTSVSLPRTTAPGWYIVVSSMARGDSTPGFPGVPGSDSSGQFQALQIVAP